MCIGNRCLRSTICLRSGVEGAHPADLVSADPLGCARHSLGAKVRRISQYTSERGRDIFRDVAGAHFESGALESVLEPWWLSFPGSFLYYLGRRLVPVPLRAFVDFVRATPPAASV